MSNLPAIRKTIAGLIGAVLTWGYTASNDGIQTNEWWGLAIAVATALGVYGVVNEATKGDDNGHVDLGLLIQVLVVIFLVVGLLLLVGAIHFGNGTG